MLIACRSFNCICAYWSVASHHVCLRNCRSMTRACQCHPTGGSNSVHRQWCVTCCLWSGNFKLCDCVCECSCVSGRADRNVLHHAWMIRHFSCWFICVLRVLTPHCPWGSVCESVDTACVFGIGSKRKSRGVFGNCGVFDAENESNQPHVSLSRVFVWVGLIMQTSL